MPLLQLDHRGRKKQMTQWDVIVDDLSPCIPFSWLFFFPFSGILAFHLFITRFPHLFLFYFLSIPNPPFSFCFLLSSSFLLSSLLLFIFSLTLSFYFVLRVLFYVFDHSCSVCFRFFVSLFLCLPASPPLLHLRSTEGANESYKHYFIIPP